MLHTAAPIQSDSRAALGVRTHSGWAAFVALSIHGDQPQVLARSRPELVESFTYKFRQPYHTAETMPLDKARLFVAGVENEAKRLAHTAIRSLQTDLRKQGYELTRFALVLASGKPLPSLDRILASHALIHTADGELFRRALLHAAERCELVAFTVKQSGLIDTASGILACAPAALTARLTALGKPMGSPWTQDEKFAALAAWISLATETQS